MLKPGALEQEVRSALQQPLSACRPAIEALTAHFGFAGLTWLWGPTLYRLDPIFFRPLILSHFGWQQWKGGWRWVPVPWNTELESWLSEVERDQDLELCQRLIHWKILSSAKFKPEQARKLFLQELRRRIDGADSPARIRQELRKLDLGYSLDEPTALFLYRWGTIHATPFILRHLPWKTRAFWEELFSEASSGDEDFAWKLYRRLAPPARFASDARRLCQEIAEPSRLNAELFRRNPDRVWGNELGGVLLQLLEARGEDVFPYVLPQLRRVWKPLFGRGNYGKLLRLALERGWLDLWASILRICAPTREFNAEVTSLTQQGPRSSARLLALSGVSNEWNLGPLALAQVHLLEPKTALALFELGPGWLRGPFKLNLQVNGYSSGYLPLLQRLDQAQEEELLDLLASRYCLALNKTPELEWLYQYYSKLKSASAFARRAANSLGKLPAYSIWNYPNLITKNPLARLFFERSVEDFLQEPQAISDLIEASEIHTMALGYRCLASGPPQLAAEHLELLLGCLFRPLQRVTRQWAFSALAVAAQGDPEVAARILSSAREAQHLPDVRYPKEGLYQLMAGILHQVPQLRRQSEQPKVYRREVLTV